MQLVSITEQYQQAFLATQATPPDDPLWIGLSSKDVRSSFPFLSKHAIGILKETVAGGDIENNRRTAPVHCCCLINICFKCLAV